MKQKDIDALLQTLLAGEDPYPVGKALGMSKRTVQRYLIKIIENNFLPSTLGVRGGPHNKKISEGIENWMVKFVEENSTATLKEIKDSLCNAFPHMNFENISLTTIHNHLDAKLITNKKQHYVAHDANSQETLRQRYLNELTNLDVNIHQIYIDETNFTIMTRRNYGRSAEGTRAVQSSVINECKKVNIIASVSPSFGWVYHEQCC